MGLSMWDGQVELMRNWKASPLSEEQFAAILADTLCKKSGAAQENGQGKAINESLMNYLIHRYREELPELGATKWAGYNALTHWSTHVDAAWTGDDGITRQTGKKTAQKHNVRRVRSDAVRSVIDSPAWETLGVAA